MDLEMTGSAETTILKIKGNWTIERSGELKPALLEALGKSERIVLDLEKVAAVDISALQLFCSAHRASLRLGKHLTFLEQKSEPLKRMVRDAGLVRTIGCNKNPNRNCLWTGDWTA
ncbi:MAG: STAS domain-containing protein [Syntrophobacteraceae bacterium]|nr:STAS domain-containing protein [Syntrophobacteraceae bacterium]